MAFSDWSTSNSGNNTSLGVNIAEGCPAANVNNGMREIMAQIRAAIAPVWDAILNKTSVAEARQALGAQAASDKLTALGGLTGGANTLPYFSGANAMQQTALTAFARSLLDDADAAAARTTLGVLAISASSLSGNGYVRFSNGFMIQWGTGVAGGNGSTTITYPTPFSSFSRPIVSGARLDTGAQDNDPATSSAGTSSFNVFSAADTSVNIWWIAVGI